MFNILRVRPFSSSVREIQEKIRTVQKFRKKRQTCVIYRSLMLKIWAVYSCFEKGCRKKGHDASIPKGNLGYDQLILISQINTSNQRCLLCCFFLALENIRPLRLLPFSQIYLKCWTQGTVNLTLPTIPFGIVACAFFPTTFLEAALYVVLHSIRPFHVTTVLPRMI